MKIFRNLAFLALMAVLAFASCKKEEISTTDVVPNPPGPKTEYQNGLLTRSLANEDGLDLICITVNYPFDLLLSDSTTVTISSEADMEQAVSDSTLYPIDFVYPLTVSNADGTTQTVGNADELGALFANCVPDTGWGPEFPDWFFPAWVINLESSCYQLTYPLSLLDTDSVATVVNTEDELIALLADGNLYSFAFPLSLIDPATGVAVSVADQNALFDLLANCGGVTPPGCGIGTFGCYQLSYPVTLIMADGSTLVVNNDDEFGNAAMTGNWINFEYPLTLIAQDSSETVVNNDDELNEAMLACGDIWGGGGDPNITYGDFVCYNFVYPFSMLDASGNTLTFNSQSEWESFASNPTAGEFVQFVYPFSLTNVDTGLTVTVNNDDELSTAVAECF